MVTVTETGVTVEYTVLSVFHHIHFVAGGGLTVALNPSPLQHSYGTSDLKHSPHIIPVAGGVLTVASNPSPVQHSGTSHQKHYPHIIPDSLWVVVGVKTVSLRDKQQGESCTVGYVCLCVFPDRE
ncbi:hypothetical protein Pmani_018074 [Petrolisthes manimaculis]|uniref:Uncharacterized protein n=1 Tax=Petrolisthes manimaculis TaxID=1843537 RepID=A0AAE1U958_9EUCA|nr:hypothetical protein Pmani_018074 [Petrolisthes manimaculis]